MRNSIFNWTELIPQFNKRYQLRETFKRNEIRLPSGMQESSLANYLNKLILLQYMERVGYGRYKMLKHIPLDLDFKEVTTKAAIAHKRAAPSFRESRKSQQAENSSKSSVEYPTGDDVVLGRSRVLGASSERAGGVPVYVQDLLKSEKLRLSAMTDKRYGVVGRVFKGWIQDIEACEKILLKYAKEIQSSDS